MRYIPNFNFSRCLKSCLIAAGGWYYSEETSMKNKAGIWIDHKQAFLVFVDEDAATIEQIASDVEAHPRYTSHTSAEDGAADDQRDKRFAMHLDKYFDEIISHLRHVESILLFGPGEAKYEFEKRLVSKGQAGKIVGVETSDKMTEAQIIAKIRKYYHFDLPVVAVI
jgi:stalled ribosome rescue protein Dom34